MSQFPLFLSVNNIPVCVCVSVYIYKHICMRHHNLLIRLSIDTWFALVFWLLWILRLWVWEHKHLFESLVLLPWKTTYLQFGVGALCILIWVSIFILEECPSMRERRIFPSVWLENLGPDWYSEAQNSWINTSFKGFSGDKIFLSGMLPISFWTCWLVWLSKS